MTNTPQEAAARAAGDLYDALTKLHKDAGNPTDADLYLRMMTEAADIEKGLTSGEY